MGHGVLRWRWPFGASVVVPICRAGGSWRPLSVNGGIRVERRGLLLEPGVHGVEHGRMIEQGEVMRTSDVVPVISVERDVAVPWVATVGAGGWNKEIAKDPAEWVALSVVTVALIE